MSSIAATEGSLTIEDWASLPEDEPGEFLDGAIVEEELATFLHEICVAWFVRKLGTWLETRGGWACGSEAKFGLSRRVGRKPDVFAYLAGTPRPRLGDGMSRLPPDIVVEIVSQTPRDARRDRVEKMAEYAAFGVRWYWLVDPAVRLVEFHERGADGRYVHMGGGGEGRLVVPGVEGLVLDLDALWAEVDAFAAEPPR